MICRNRARDVGLILIESHKRNETNCNISLMKSKSSHSSIPSREKSLFWSPIPAKSNIEKAIRAFRMLERTLLLDASILKIK